MKTFKNMLKGIRSQETITDLTVITNTNVHFSGKIDDFTKNCDINMTLYRNDLLNKPVKAKDSIGSHLFVFLMDAKEEVEEQVAKLGYSGTVEIATVSVGRIIVFVNDERLGVYDLNKHTFVDEKE